MSAAAFNKYFTRREEALLLKTIRKQSGCLLARRDLAWIGLIRHTGIRIGAMSQLTVGDAERALSENQLYLRAEIQKRGIKHQVYAGKRTLEALRELIRARKAMRHVHDWDAPLVMSRQRHGLSVRTYQHRFHHWCMQAGVPQLGPHALRHTLAKRIIEVSSSNDPLTVVQHVLGHSDRRSTQVYTMPDKEQIMRDLEMA